MPPSSATFLDESVVFSLSDVVGGHVLSVGDVVSIGGMQFNFDRKRRQARVVSLVKAAPKAQQGQAGQQYATSERRIKRATATAGSEQSAAPASTTTMRFARGPDDTRGFASRRGTGQQGVTVGLQRTSSNTTAVLPASSSSSSSATDGFLDNGATGASAATGAAG